MSEVEIFKALGDPTRLKILKYIRNKEKCICEIIPYTGRSQPNVSQHLKVLKNAKIVDERKDGTRIIIKVVNYEIFNIIDKVKNISNKL